MATHQQLPFDTAEPLAEQIRIVVYGVAQPAGSKRAFVRGGRAHVVDDNPKSRPWKQTLAVMAGQAMEGRPLLQGPLEVDFTFVVARPKGHLGARGNLNTRGRATPYPITRPDVLKLTRGAEDALTGVVWHDDAQIVAEHLFKTYGDPPRVEIYIRQLQGGEA